MYGGEIVLENRMSPVWKRRFLSVLRDPAIKQGFGRLIQGESEEDLCVCAYGALAKALADHGKGKIETLWDGEILYHDPLGRAVNGLPSDLMFEIVGMPNKGFTTLMVINEAGEVEERTLTSLNDSHAFTLPEIADLVEEQW